MALRFDELESEVDRRVSYLSPQDPSRDNFDQRFRGRGSRERSYPVPPGYQERFGDPTKVISEIPQVGKNSDKQPYRVAQMGGGLPEGFKFDDETTPKGLPPGFQFDDAPADPHGRAALRTQRSVTGGRQEGKATAAIESVVPAIGREVSRMGGIMERAVKTGDIPPNEAAEVALMASPVSAAYKTGVGVSKAMVPPAERLAKQQQIETGVMSIPRAAEAGPLGQTIATRFGGTPQAAQRASAELTAAGEGAAVRAAGGEVDQAVANKYLSEAITKAGDSVQPRLALLNEGGRDPIEFMVWLAQTGSKDDIIALRQLRRVVPAEQQGAVQGAFIQRLGQAEGRFAPEAFISNYGKLSDRMKNILFGQSGPNSLRFHLDSIEGVSRRAPTWKHLEQGESPVMGLMLAGGASMLPAGPIAGPLAVLAGVIPLHMIGKHLAKPATAAPIAQWSRAYERVMRTNGAPQALAAFTIATRNLNTNLGTEIDPSTLFRGPSNGQPVE